MLIIHEPPKLWQ